MKPIRANYSIVVALTVAFAFYYSAFAQVPLEKGPSTDDVAKETGRNETTKESKTRSGKPAETPAKNTSTDELIGLLPRDILTSRTGTPETRMPYFSALVSSPVSVKQPGISDDHRVLAKQLLNPAASLSRISFESNLDLALAANRQGNRNRSENNPAQLAKQLLNPVSSLARISLESNVDFGLAADREGYRYIMNLEPVLPFVLGENWSLISRTRIQLAQQDGIIESSVQSGLGDMLQSFFLSPRNSGPVFWGAGAALLIPTATDTQLGTGKFGLGPAIAAGSHSGPWTYSVLARHISSVAGHCDRQDVSWTFIRPSVAFTTKSAWIFALDAESTYDWVNKQWSVPIHVEVSKILNVGRHPVSFGGALTCWAATPPGGPQACGVRFMITPLFPVR